MNRSFDILSFLLQKDTSITVLELANMFFVSEKSVRNDLISLDPLLARYHLRMIRKSGLGVYIEGELTSKQQLLEFLRTNQFPLIDSSDDRLLKLLIHMLSSDHPVLMKELSLDYYVSRTTIANDVVLLNEKIKKYDLNIVYQKSKGLLMVGEETNKRKVLSDLLPYGLENHLFERQSNSSVILSSQMLMKLNEVLQVDFLELERILHEAEVMLGYTFSTEAFINLVIHLGIAINRTQTGNSIELTAELKEKLRTYSEFDIARQTALKIEEKYQIVFNESEIYYILLHFLGAKTIENILDLEIKISLEQKEMEQAISMFICCVQTKLHLLLEHDTQLFNSLLLHLRPTINRMVYGLSLHNPLKDEIFKNYPDIYHAIQQCISILSDAYDISFPDDEIAYLILHVAAAVERSISNTRVLIACASGIGMSQLLVARIERLFKNIEIVACVSVLDLYRYRDQSIDLIISTVNIGEFKGIRTVIVNPLLSEFDITTIRANLAMRDTRVSNKNLFLKDRVFDLSVPINKRGVIDFINQTLLEDNMVSKKYYKSIIEREEIGSTYIGYGVAVVHGDTKEVQKSCLQIVRLSCPVLWDNTNQVSFVLNFVSTQKDAELFTTLFKQIGIRLDDDEFWKKVMKLNDKHELCSYLNKELLYDYQ